MIIDLTAGHETVHDRCEVFDTKTLYFSKGDVMDQEKLDIIAEFWNEQADSFEKNHDTEKPEEWCRHLSEMLQFCPGGDVLDVGTGTGFLALLLARQGYRAAGVDLAGELIELAKKKARAQGLSINFQKAPCEDLPFPDDSFDAVVNCRMMWSLTEPVLALKEWRRVLKPGGMVLTYMRMIPFGESEEQLHYGNRIFLPLWESKREDYIKVYREAGFTNIRVLELPQEMSYSDMMPWTLFVGECPTENG